MSNVYTSLIDEKIAELNERINAMKTNDVVAKSTRSTQLHHMRREAKTLSLIRELIDEDTKLSNAAHDTLISLTTLLSTRSEVTACPVAIGDKLPDLLKREMDGGRSAAKAMERIEKACAKNKLRIDFITQVIVADEDE